MVITYKHFRRIFLSTMLINIIFLLGCSATPEEAETTQPPLPEYIRYAGPVRVSKEQYEASLSTNFIIARGIPIAIWANRMGVADEDCHWENIKQRSLLLIDGEKTSDATLVGGADGEPGCGLFRLSWAPALDPGLHSAIYQFSSEDGQVFEYSWQIYIER